MAYGKQISGKCQSFSHKGCNGQCYHNGAKRPCRCDCHKNFGAHSEGPWYVQSETNSIITDRYDPTSVIAAARFMGGDNAVGNANARLLAAAPDLLAALKEFVAITEGNGAVKKKAIAALKKAEGK